MSKRSYSKVEQECNDCGRAFSEKSKLNGHIESVHEGKKPFKCNECDTAFSEKSKLNGHLVLNSPRK